VLRYIAVIAATAFECRLRKVAALAVLDGPGEAEISWSRKHRTSTIR
jgi:hypothetical protein